MHALIMAGGSGNRLNLGEKPLILIRDRPMISYVIDAFLSAGHQPLIGSSRRTPMTANWCRANGIEVCKAEGRGYVEDMISIVTSMGERSSLFISVADIPCITPEIIRAIGEAYLSSGKEGCSTWVPSVLVSSCREGMPYRKTVSGTEASPAGINILRGERIDHPQDELQILLNEPGLALNVNTRADRTRAEDFLKQHAR